MKYDIYFNFIMSSWEMGCCGRQQLRAASSLWFYARMMHLPKEHLQVTCFRFDRFVLDPARKELRRDGKTVELAPQPLTALLVLVSSAQKLVLRETLKKEIWGELASADVEDTLNHCVARLRKLLGDDARAPRYIATVARMGYRFIAEVSRFQDSHVAPSEPGVTTARGDKILIEIASVRSQISGAPLFSDGVVAATLRNIHALLGERVCAIDRFDSTTHGDPHGDIYRIHVWVQPRQTCLRVSCHLTEPTLRSVVQCAVFDVHVDEILDEHDAVANEVVKHLLIPLLRE